MWVSVTGGSCTRSVTPVAYSQVTSCSTLQAANSTCQGGDLTYVQAGTYAHEVISGSNGRTGARCTLKAAPRAVPVFSVDNALCTACNPESIQVQGSSHLTLDSLTAGYGAPVLGHQVQGRLEVDTPSNDVTLNNMDVGAFSSNASNIAINGGDFGPSEDPSNMRLDNTTNVAFNRVTIHDFRADNGGHMECMTLEAGVTNLTIENSTFSNCADFSIFAKPSSGGPISGVTIVNDVFHHTCCAPTSNEIKFTNTGGGSCNNVKILFNRLAENIYDGECTDPVVVKGNVLHVAQASCGTGWDYNIWDQSVTTCGSHAATSAQAALFANAPAGDFHPAGSALSEAYVPNFLGAPTTDKDGNTRPKPAGANLDAGPYE